MRAVDLFAGLGGFSEGARLAGVPVVWAANHWKAAVDIHALNHPGTAHACQDLQQADWRHVPAHDLLLASPACQGHADARGAERPHHDAARSTAWAVVACAEYHRPSFVIVENVPEFRAWILFPAWRAAMIALGYALEEIVSDAADHGIPQHRERLFIIATKARAPLGVRLERRPHVAIGPSIRFGEFKWSALADKVPATQARAARGRAEHGERFVMPYYGSGSGLTGRSLARPLGTVTTRDRWALVDGDKMRMLQRPEYLAAMGFRPDYSLPTSRTQSIFMLGNAVCPPQAADLIGAVKAAAA